MSNTNVANKEGQSTTNPNSTAAGAPAVANNANGGESNKRRTKERPFTGSAGRGYAMEIGRRLRTLGFSCQAGDEFLASLKQAEHLAARIAPTRQVAEVLSAELAKQTADLAVRARKLREWADIEDLDLGADMLANGSNTQYLNRRMSHRGITALVKYSGLVATLASREEVKTLARQAHTAATHALASSDRASTATGNLRQVYKEMIELWRQVNGDLSALKHWLRVRKEHQAVYAALFEQTRGVSVDDLSPAALKLEGTTT